MESRRISTPYSYAAAVEAGDFVFLGLSRGPGDNFGTQINNTLKNIQQILGEFGLNLTHLVKVNVWLKHIEDLPEMENIFRNYFEKDKYPARMTSTTQFIDEDCLIMIDGIAYRGKGY